MKKSRLPNGMAGHRYASSGRLLFLNKISEKTMMTLFILMTAAFQIQAGNPAGTSAGKTIAESNRISIVKKSTSLKEALKEVEKQTQFRFFYNDQQVNVREIVSVNVVDAPINKALDEIFKHTTVYYQLNGRQILLYNRLRVRSDSSAISEALPSLPHFDKIIHKIQGKITGAAGEPIPGVNVVVKGTTVGSSSDGSGEYVLNAPDKDVTLVFSFIGYVTREIPVNGRSVLDSSFTKICSLSK